jgi:serpin B
VTTNKKYYSAEISSLDFNSPDAVKTINNWVAAKTQNKIQNIIEEIKPSQVMFLLNAIYFKGAWQKEFNTKSTSDLPFYPENGKSIQVPTMQRLDTVPYMSNEVFSAIKLNYGKGNYNMYIFLPNQGKTISDFIKNLNKANWESWIKNFKTTNSVDIRFPKLKYAYDIKLNDALTSMGMGVAFTGAADFRGINRDGGLYIDYVRHKTFIELNEEGTEAAAVTIVAIDKMSAGPQKIPFYLNQPFIYAITEKDTGTILFIGSVKNPVAKQE